MVVNEIVLREMPAFSNTGEMHDYHEDEDTHWRTFEVGEVIEWRKATEGEVHSKFFSRKTGLQLWCSIDFMSANTQPRGKIFAVFENEEDIERSRGRVVGIKTGIVE